MRAIDVSVIMAVRNGAAHLARALESIGTVADRTLEIVLVDGHSTDATVEIASRHPRVRIVSQIGSGIAAAYNQGVAECRGETIAFLSHDDLWTRGKLARQLAVLDAEPATMLVFGMVRHVLAGTAPLGFRSDLIDRDVPGYIMETLLMRRAAFDRVGPFDTRLSTAEDVDWIARARDAGLGIAMMPERLLIKRIHQGNASLLDPRGQSSLLDALRAAAGRRRGAF